MSDRLDFDRRRLPEAALALLPRQALILDERRSRPLWFDGRFLTAAALAREQSYVLSRQADLARTLGAGVIEGLMVEEVAGRATALTIRRGHGLTPAGDPVVLPRDITVDLANVAEERLLERALGRPDRPVPPRETRSGLFVLALRPLEYTAEPAAAFPTTIDEPRRAEDGVVREVALLTLIPLAGAGALDDARLRRARAAERVFGPGGAGGLDLPPDAVPLAALELASNAVQWLDVWIARREAGLAATDILGLGLAVEPVRAAHLRQYDAMLADLLEERGGSGAGLAAAERFALLPAAGRLPREAVALANDPATGQPVLTQAFFPPQLPVELSLVPEDEVAAVLEESLMLPPIRLDAPAEVLESQAVMALVPLPRAELLAAARTLGRIRRVLPPRLQPALSPLRPADLLPLLRGRALPPPPAPPLGATAEEQAWVDLVNARGTLWFARVRQLAAADDLLPVLRVERTPARLTGVEPQQVLRGATFELAVSGRGLEGATALVFDRDDIAARVLSAEAERVRAEVRVQTTVPPGPRNFVLALPGGTRAESAAFGLALGIARPPATLAGVEPQQVVRGRTVELAITGSGLAGATALVFDREDIVARILAAEEERVRAQVAVQITVPPEPRNFTLHMPGAQVESAAFGLALQVERPAAALTAIVPQQVLRGTTFELVVSGRGMAGAIALAFDRDDITARLLSVEDERLRAQVTVQATVPTGPRTFSLTLPDGTQVGSASFDLALQIEQPTAALTGIAPPQVGRGVTFELAITGRGLAGATALTFDRPGLTARVLSAQDDRVRAEVGVQGTVATGPANFALTLPGGVQLQSASFGLSLNLMSLPSALTGIAPPQVLRGTTFELTITGRELAGATALTFDRPGLTARVLSAQDDRVRAEVGVQGTAAPGPANFVLVVGGAQLQSASFGVPLRIVAYGYGGIGRAVGGDLL